MERMTTGMVCKIEFNITFFNGYFWLDYDYSKDPDEVVTAGSDDDLDAEHLEEERDDEDRDDEERDDFEGGYGALYSGVDGTT